MPWNVCSRSVINWPISSWVWAVTRRIRRPSRTIGNTAIGKTTKAASASRQSWMNITATRPANDSVSLPNPVSTLETAARISPTSTVKREISRPVALSWKNCKSMRARCPNRRF